MESEKQLLQHKQSCRGSELILLYIYTSYSFDHSTVTASLWLYSTVRMYGWFGEQCQNK